MGPDQENPKTCEEYEALQKTFTHGESLFPLLAEFVHEVAELGENELLHGEAHGIF